jgi:hypothetical protein
MHTDGAGIPGVEDIAGRLVETASWSIADVGGVLVQSMAF